MKATLTTISIFIAQFLFAQYVGLDDSYAGGDGISSPAFAGASNNSQSHHMIVDDSDNSFHFGYTELDGNLAFSCAKLNSSGNYASGFGQSGQTVIGTEYAITSLEGADFYPTGKILICGTFYDDNYPNYGGVVFRMNTNGTLDPTFSNDLTGSFLQTEDADYNITAIGCSVFDNLKSIAAFTYEDPNVVSLMLVRFTVAGDEDQTFDDDGILFVTLSDALRVTDIKDDGTNMFFCGTYEGFDSNIGVVLKIDQNGNFVSGFGNGADAQIGNTSDVYDPQAIHVTDEGDIFVTGSTGSGAAFVAKMNFTGGMDNTFGDNGIAYYNNTTQPVGLSLSVTPEGLVMIAGKETDSNGHDLSFIARFNTDGTPDETFGTSGIYYPEFEFEEDIILGLHVLNDGDFLTTGYGHMSGDPDQYICAKFHTSGAGVEQYNQSWPTIYPNPVTDELFIRTNDLRITTIHLTDVMGNTILTSKINSPQSRIDLSTLPSGIYHVTAMDGQGRTWTKSVVKG